MDEKSRVTYAVARVDDPYRLQLDGPALPIGTFVSAEIRGATAEDIVRVPRSVVRGSDKLILVDEQDRLRTRRVDIVRTDADYAYVSADTLAGSRVLLTAIESPVNGMSVRTRDARKTNSEGKSVVASGEAD